MKIYRDENLSNFEFWSGAISNIEEQDLHYYAIMEFLGFERPRCFVEPGAWYTERNFVAYNEVTGILVIEVRESLNV